MFGHVWGLHCLQVWRLRVYQAERTVGAAKPLLFLKQKLNLQKSQAQRIMWAYMTHLTVGFDLK